MNDSPPPADEQPVYDPGPPPPPADEQPVHDAGPPPLTDSPAPDALPLSAPPALDDPEEPSSESGPVAAPVESTDPAQKLDTEELLDRLTVAERRTDELLAVTRRQSEMTDRLHAENQQLRDGEIREAVAPLVRGLARVADDLDRIRAARNDDDPDLTHLDSRLRDVLADAGVNAVSPQIGESFDARAHQVTGVAPTDDEALERTIAEVRRTGLIRDDGRVLRAADVVVYRFTVPIPPPPREPQAADVQPTIESTHPS